MSSTFAPSVTSTETKHIATRPYGRWINVVPHLDPKYGGMSSAVPALSAAVAAGGSHSTLIAGFCAEEQHAESETSHASIYRLPGGYANWLTNRGTRQDFTRLVGDCTGVHIHGLWEQSTFAAARTCKKTGKPYVISAHGMLQRWALDNKRWKKAIYGALIERANLANAACLHALTHAEAEDYRAFGLNNPVAVIPNGVRIPSDNGPDAFLKAFPQLRGKRIVLFLSRIHFKKGLDILCQAWASAAKRWPDAQLVLAGPDSENTQASIEQLIAELGIGNRVTFTGMLGTALKWSALSAADCFVLPSYSEGLSVSVLEAMGMGLPVIVTKQCNLPEVAAHECGWVTEPNAAELEAAIDECLRGTSSCNAEIGLRGRALVKEKYSWRVVGQQMSDLYSWVQSGGAPPARLEIEFGGTQ